MHVYIVACMNCDVGLNQACRSGLSADYLSQQCVCVMMCNPVLNTCQSGSCLVHIIQALQQLTTAGHHAMHAGHHTCMCSLLKYPIMQSSTVFDHVQACNKYHEAWQLQNNSHAALYNWGVALSDMAHLEKRNEQDAAYHCLLAAAEKYALSLFYSANNPQVCTELLPSSLCD